MLAEKILAGLALAVCVALLVRMSLGAGLRARLDRGASRFWRGLGQGAQSLLQSPARRRQARQVAQDAIRRAQGKAASGRARGQAKGQWDGNVYKPDAFGSRDDADPPPPRRDLH